MRMNFWGLFWGLFFVLMGLSILLRVFGLNIPFFKILIGLFIIFIGIRIMVPGAFRGCCGGWETMQQTGRDTIFAESNISGKDLTGEYNVIFGSGKIDLTQVELKDKNVDIKINTVFGGAQIMIDKTKPVKIVANAAFGGVKLPNGNAAAFGTTNYTTDSYKEGQPHINITADAVFGGIDIK